MPTASEVLAKVPLFSMLSKRELEKLAKEVHDRTFPAGTVLTEEDEFGTIFTVIAEGEATVSVRGKPVRKLKEGDFFGEMGLIDRSPRSATVRADSELRCLMLTQPVFRPFAITHPETMWALLELMVRRVREAESRDPDAL
ncbi:MAG: cyclic nucleotide-binding domain-containing protein [Actinomycetota bacterium]|jgi:CRP/FNR family cyclic AMP-dependent transcriptional regulator|nr:cyclic nucleotide-binding domain-containing protein [Actinomycetota bacterium]